VFANGCTIEAAEVVCATTDTGSGAVLDILTSLVAKSLVLAEVQETGSTRYRLLETLRAYGRQRLDERRDGRAAEAQHAQFFLKLCEQSEPELLGPRQALWVRRLQLEHENLRVALSRSLGHNWIDTALRLAGGLVRFWFWLGYLSEGRTWLARLLPLAEHAQPSVRAKLLYGSALMAQFQGDYSAVEDPIHEALALWREIGNQVEVAQSLYLLGSLHWMRGQRIDARARLLESLDIARAAEHPLVQGLVLRGLADLAFEDGDHVLARVHAQDALAIARDIGWTRTMSQALRILGEISFREGDWTTARGHLEASISAAREVGDGFWVASVLPRLAYVVLTQGETTSARSLLAESLAAFRNLGDKSGIVRCLEGSACLAAALREDGSAVSLAATAASIRHTIKAPISPPEAATLDRWLVPAHRRLRSAEVEAARRDGEHMTVEQAIGLALSVRPDGNGTRATVGPSVLSPREVQVAHLVTDGLTNRQIGERLVITPGTAALHVKHILAKLSFNSRSQIAAWIGASRASDSRQ
jgi:non-specific serine/threonine protein kinase